MKALKIGDLFRYKESTICRIIDTVPDHFGRYPVWCKEKGNFKAGGWFRWMAVLEAGYAPIEVEREAKYRFLNAGEKFLPGDESLDDDTVTWIPVSSLVLRSCYWPNVMQPVRRREE